MPKKTLYIILIIFVVLLIIGVSIWYLFFYSGQEAALPGAGFTVNGNAFQEQGSLKFKSISDGPIVSANYNAGQNLVLFYDYAGQLWQYNENSGKTAADQSLIANLADVVWSANLKHILKSGENESDAKYLFSDFTKKSLTTLRSGIKSSAFSPDSGKIAYYVFESQKTNSLLISDPDGKNQRILISNFKLRDVIISWPKTNLLGITTRPSGLVAGSHWTLNTLNSVISKSISNLFGLETLYAPDGSALIYSFVDQNGSNPKLSAIDKKGLTKELGISTLTDKCAWMKDSVNVLCAVPASWPESMLLPDDFYKKSRLTNDNIWKINIDTGEKELIASDLGDIGSLLVGDSGNVLYFISRNNQFLYQLTP